MDKPIYLGLSILEISEILYMNYGTVILNQSIKTMQNYVTRMQIALLLILKLKIFTMISLMMLKKD